VPLCCRHHVLCCRQGLIVARPARESCCLCYALVPHGFYALVAKNGAEIDEPGSNSPVWSSGFHFVDCFSQVTHLVTRQFVVFDTPVQGCKTSDDVNVIINSSVVFRIMGDDRKGEDPKLVPKFVHDVTAAGLQQQLQDALSQEMRTLARSMKHTEVYACRSGLAAAQAQPVVAAMDRGGSEEGAAVPKGEKMPLPPLVGAAKAIRGGDEDSDSEIGEAREPDEFDFVGFKGIDVTIEMKNKLNEQFKPQGVEIVDVIIQDITLPQEISVQMTNRSMVKSLQAFEKMTQQHQIQAIKLKNELDMETLNNQEDAEKFKAEKGKSNQVYKDQYDEQKEIRAREYNSYKKTTQVEQQKIAADMKEVTLRLRLEREQALQQLALEAEEQAVKITAEAAAKIQEMEAETELQVAQMNGEAQKALAAAELASNKHLAKKREFELTDKQLDIYNKLSMNPDLVVTASEDEKTNLMMMADSVLKSEQGKEGDGAMLANLNMLRLASNAYGLSSSVYIPSNDVAGAESAGAGGEAWGTRR